MAIIFKTIELFAGIGSQSRALYNIFENKELLKLIGVDPDNIKQKIVAISEWNIKSILAYDELHHGLKSTFDGYEKLLDKKEKMLDFLSGYTLSNDGSKPYPHSKIEKMDVEEIRDLYISIIRSNNLGSVKDIKGDELPKANLLTWSFPCTDLSTAGKGKGIKKGSDTSSSLLWEVDRILDEMGDKRPKALLMENVPGLLHKKHFNDWKKVEKSLEDKGYKNTLIELNSKDFGVPQSRNRVFCISILDSKKNIQVQKQNSYPPLKEYIGVDNDDFTDEYKAAILNNTSSRRTKYINENTHLNFRDYTDTITKKQDRNPNAGILFCDKNGKLVDNLEIDINMNGKNSCYRVLTPREQCLLTGLKSSDYDKLVNIGFSKADVEALAGNSIVVPVLEAIFVEIIREIIPKKRKEKPQRVTIVKKPKVIKKPKIDKTSKLDRRVVKIVATKTKKMKAKVLKAIEELKKQNKKINPFAISKVAGISYVTARKYWKNLSSHYIATWSGGKDSTYMILELLRKKEPLDEIIFSDTGYEFPQMYEYIEKVEKYINENYPHVKITKLNYKSSDTWEKWAEKPFTRGENEGSTRGFPYWIGMSWCTRELKVIPIDKYLKENVNVDFIVKYIGIAADEPKRVRDSGESYPLVKWKITEKQIVKRLKKMNFHNSLYNNFSRTGCYLCPKQGLGALKILHDNYPTLWEHVVELEQRYKKQGSKIWKFKGIGTKQLQDRFKSDFVDGLEEEIGCLCK